MNRISLIIPVLFIVLLSAASCYTGSFSLSVLQPADTVLPASLKRISILPMPGVPSPTGSFDSLVYPRPKQVNAVKMGYIHGIHSVFSASPFFTKVKLTDTITAPFVKDARIYWTDLEQICKHDTTDAVLVLSKAVSYAVNYSNSAMLYQYMDFSLQNKTRWIFYRPFNQSTAARFNFSDTLRFSEFDGSLASELLYEACFATGVNSGKKMVPYWRDVTRIIYTGPGKDLRKAAEFAFKQDWYNAGMIWNELADHKKTSVASRAAFNLAVAYERDDDLEQAYLWISYADSLHSAKLNSLYKTILETRTKNQVTLNRQVTGK